jgi:hypothetical protein
MKSSTDRILTTHTGSLPRPKPLLNGSSISNISGRIGPCLPLRARPALLRLSSRTPS